MSRVPVGEVEFHLPLTDFHTSESEAGDKIVAAPSRKLFESHVALFRSGKSCHVYGLALVETEGLRRPLTRALLVGPIVDRADIAQRLPEGACWLRLGIMGDEGPLPTFRFFVGGAGGKSAFSVSRAESLQS